MITFYNPNIPPHYFSSDDSFTSDEVVYPSGWLRSAAESERENLGFVAVNYGPRPDDVWCWVEEIRNGASITYKATPKDIVQLRQLQISKLTQDCAAAIVGGYVSSALGTPHTYPMMTTDQINMMGSVTASMLPDLPPGWTTPFWCSDADNNWAMVAHTAPQIQQAGADGKAWVAACQTKLVSLVAAVQAAPDIAAIQGIAW